MSNYKIKIKRNPNGDARTAPKNISFEQFQEANNMHKRDVRRVMESLGNEIILKGNFHDYTKKSEEKLFYNNFLDTINNDADFVNNDWYQLHIAEERHHLLSRCPGDVDLLDVVEMIVDCVCAGKARAGEVRSIEINDEILRKALDNTVLKVNDMTELED